MTNSAHASFSAEISSLLFEFAADPIFILDMDGNFIEVNQAACDHTGYSRDELLQMGPQHLDDAAAQQQIPERLAQLRQEGKATFNAVHVRRDGRRVPVEMHIRMIEHCGKKLTLNICRDVSERIQNEVEYQHIVQTTTDGFWVVDAHDARILDVNEAYCRMVGYSRKELLTMRIFDVESSETSEQTAAHIRKVMETGHDFFETKHRHKDGHLVEIEISVSYSSSRNGVFFVFARDISERKRFIRELVQSRQDFEQLYNNAPCGYHSIDSNGTIIGINQTEADWLGYSQDELIGRKIAELCSPPGNAYFSQDFPRFKFEGHIENIEVDLIRKDGTILNALLSSNAEYDAKGNFVKNRTTVIDISKRKQAVYELSTSEERFRQLFENAPVGISLARQDQLLFTANAAFCKMFGYTAQELTHLSINDLTHPDFLDKTRQLSQDLLAGQIPLYTFEKKYLRKDGSSFWGKIIATEVPDQKLQSRLIMGIVEDINERVEKEELRLHDVRVQRDVLVREVHHRIKNNLQGVVGLLRQNASDHPQMAGVIETTLGRIYAIAIIHGLQAASVSEAVDIDRLLLSIVEASECCIDYHNNLSCSVLLNQEEAVPIALALNELLTNACKHRTAKSRVNLSIGNKSGVTQIVISNEMVEHPHPPSNMGQGLNLVKSLLPRRNADLLLVRAGNIYSAELKLSPPVTIGIADDVL